ncbi:MAG TPA: aminotransferase class I/II-fold pyridoxal phosphate-dependent enzyme [Anaeromyxobacteraceae bacterium]
MAPDLTGARVHGGPVAAELAALGFAPRDVVDLSVNVNPYGPAPAVLEAARGAALDRYPDAGATAVREALGARFGRAPGEVLFAHGAAELLWDLARHLARGRVRTLVVEPAFSELRAGLAASGAEVVAWRADPGRGLAVDVEAVAEAIARSGAGAAYLAAPTSPTGAPVPAADVAWLARAREGALVVLDESFLALSDRHADADVPLPPNVVRLRSMTKDHAIPGLRVGYLLGPAALVAALDAARPAWSTSAPAQAAALAALGEEAFVAASRERLRLDREAMLAGLTRLGFAPLPSVAPYLAFPADDAAALRRRLLALRVLVRDCASFGLPGFVRVAARPEAEREALFAALAREIP